MSNETKSLMQRLDSIEEAVEHLGKQMNMVTEILERIVSKVNSDEGPDLRTTDLFDAISEGYKPVASRIVTHTKNKSGDA